MLTQVVELPLVPAAKCMLASPAAVLGYSGVAGAAMAGVGRFRTAAHGSAVAADLVLQPLALKVEPLFP